MALTKSTLTTEKRVLEYIEHFSDCSLEARELGPERFDVRTGAPTKETTLSPYETRENVHFGNALELLTARVGNLVMQSFFEWH